MLLLRGRPERVESWARTGQVPAYVVPLRGWTALCPTAEPPAGGPYGDPLELFAGRAVPRRLRPAVGLYLFGQRAVVTVHREGRRAIPQWLVWQPGDALVAARPLAPARIADLAKAAGLAREPASARIARVLLEPSGEAPVVLAELWRALSLPGGTLFDGSVAPTDVDGTVLVEPSPVHAARFHAAAREEAQQRAELEGR
jgi:hypothetical protein